MFSIGDLGKWMAKLWHSKPPSKGPKVFARFHLKTIWFSLKLILTHVRLRLYVPIYVYTFEPTLIPRRTNLCLYMQICGNIYESTVIRMNLYACTYQIYTYTFESTLVCMPASWQQFPDLRVLAAVILRNMATFPSKLEGF